MIGLWNERKYFIDEIVKLHVRLAKVKLSFHINHCWIQAVYKIDIQNNTKSTYIAIEDLEK